jgi:hypothetical protein
MSWKLGSDSFTKCVVYFLDGNTRTFYSLDWPHKYSKLRDRELGLKRLRNLIGKWSYRANTAIIYDNSTGNEIEKYHQGIKQI